MGFEEQEARAAKALFRLMKNFSLLEQNLGLAIAHLENPGRSELSYPNLTKYSMDKMLERLGVLLAAEPGRLSDIKSSEYETWRESAQHVRRIRNQFVHGWFDLLPLDESTPVHLMQPPWWSNRDVPPKMPMQDLEGNVNEVETVFKDLCRLRQKYKF